MDGKSSPTNRCSCPLVFSLVRRIQLVNAMLRWFDAAGQLNSMLGGSRIVLGTGTVIAC
jgi:hypothetical protein